MDVPQSLFLSRHSRLTSIGPTQHGQSAITLHPRDNELFLVDGALVLDAGLPYRHIQVFGLFRDFGERQ
jgi:hypothetical protein